MLGVIAGILVLFVGLFSIFKLNRLTKYLELLYEDRKVRFEQSTQNKKHVKKLWFLYINPVVYYHNEKQTRYLLLFISLIFIIWGIAIVLAGLEIVE